MNIRGRYQMKIVTARRRKQKLQNRSTDPGLREGKLHVSSFAPLR